MLENHRNNLGGTRGALLSSIVLGDKVSDLPSQVKRNFRLAGVSHLLAASGFNLSLFAGAVFICLRLVTRSVSIVCLAGIISILSFVLLSGNSPSVLRAAIWAALLLLLKLSYRRVHLGALFSFALFLHLIIDPFSIMDIGWQLSYAATAAILCRVDDSQRENKSVSSRVKSACGIVLMAQAAVLPLACLYFKQLNYLFLFSNLCLDPFVAPLTILGFISSWIGLVSRELAWCLDMVCYYPLEYMLTLTHFFASLKFSQLKIEPPPVWILSVYTLSFVYFVKQKRSTEKSKIFPSLIYFLSLVLLLLASICP